MLNSYELCENGHLIIYFAIQQYYNSLSEHTIQVRI